MKKFFLLSVMIIMVLGCHSEIIISIEDLTISNIKIIDYKAIIESKDTITVTEGVQRSPYASAHVLISNTSNSVITFSLGKSPIIVEYLYRGKSYQKRMSFVINTVNHKQSEQVNQLIIGPDENFELYLSDYIIPIGSTLELKMKDTINFTDFLLEILPTMFFKYIDKDNKIMLDFIKIKNVNINHSKYNPE